MSSFGTSNICWVPEDQQFRFIDLHRWTEWRLDVHRWRVALAKEMLPALHQRAERWIRDNREQAADDPELAAAFDRGEAALGRLDNLVRPAPAQLLNVDLPQGPLEAAWVRISDLPLESFHDEDYEADGEEEVEVARIPIDGALAFPAIRMEIPVLSATGPSFSLVVPSLDCVAEYPLPVDEIPAITDEFCGVLGNSNRGKMANLNLEGRIAPENPVAIPLRRTSASDLFATLYMHFQTPMEHAVSMPLRPSQTIRLEETLRTGGFEVFRHDDRNAIWRRGDDWVHTLWDLPGSEGEGVPSLPPLVAVPRADGSSQSKSREALLGDILRAALGNGRQSKP